MRENKKVKFAAPVDINLSGSNEVYFWNILWIFNYGLIVDFKLYNDEFLLSSITLKLYGRKLRLKNSAAGFS